MPADPGELLEYEPSMLEYVEELNTAISAFFENYISLLECYRAVHHVYKPFISEYLHQRGSFPQENDLAKFYEQYNLERRDPFDSIKCDMHSFGYKVLYDSRHQPILCDKMHFSDLQSFLFYDFFNGIRRSYLPNQCKQCGKFFLIRAGKYFSYCDRPHKDDPGKTCRDVGARKRYDEKCKTDPVWQIYNRAYKAHYARYMKKRMTVAEFEQWSSMASKLRDMAIADEIPFEQYYAEIRK